MGPPSTNTSFSSDLDISDMEQLQNGGLDSPYAADVSVTSPPSVADAVNLPDTSIMEANKDVDLMEDNSTMNQNNILPLKRILPCSVGGNPKRMKLVIPNQEDYATISSLSGNSQVPSVVIENRGYDDSGNANVVLPLPHLQTFSLPSLSARSLNILGNFSSTLNTSVVPTTVMPPNFSSTMMSSSAMPPAMMSLASTVENDGEVFGDNENSDIRNDRIGLISTIRENFREDKVFQLVCGRTCLVGTITKYPVTLGEIRRRVYGPEALNQSLINGILRIAKIKSNGESLRQRLLCNGLDIPVGRRKLTELTCFSSLCEAESIKMAKQFGEIAQSTIDFTKLTPMLFNLLHQRAGQQTHIKNILDAARVLLEVFFDFFARYGDDPARYRLNTSDQADRQMNRFNLVTHSFGTIAMKEAVDVLITMTHDMQHSSCAYAVDTFNQSAGHSAARF